MSLSRTISRLKRGQQAFAAAYPASGAAFGGSGALRPLDLAFSNPGNLNALCYLPERQEPPTGLLVVLHGCTQQAEPYDSGAGWSRLAERHGFALLYPEQKRENNHNLCFNWYQEGDATRGRGEAASIAAMVAAMQAAHGIGPDRTFVTGLSAGGAMTAAMLATYPELFGGGAIIAGLPYGCARNVAEAFDCMGGRLPRDPAALAAKVRAASPHAGPWPRLSVWHGGADHIVSPANTDALLSQWTALHGLSATPHRSEVVDGHQRRIWLAPNGSEAIEHYHVAGMAHGTPLMPGTGEGQSGRAGAHMLDVGLSSTDRIATFFGLAPAGTSVARPVTKAAPPKAAVPSPPPAPALGQPAAGVQKVIEDALRSAGLMR
jgi:poly(hydroxyalkanoate) depolymerase family esterase